MDIDRAKLYSDVLAIWLSIFALLAGGIFTVMQYTDKVRGDRVKETMEFLDRYHSASLESARDRISSAWARHAEENNSYWKGNAFDQEGHSKFIVKMAQTEGLEQDLLKVFDFYSALDVCIVEEICDAQSAVKIFQPEAASIFFNFHPFVLDLRKSSQDNSIGSAIESVARRK